MTSKSDKEQLKGILEEFELVEVKGVLDELVADEMPSCSKFKNQGKKCPPGVDGCIGKDEFEHNQEAVWGDTNFLSAHFLIEGSEIQKAIAMVTLKVAKGSLTAGSGWGSGFLISNSLFMTNNHVIPSVAFCDDINMQFLYQDNYNSEPALTSEFFETNEDSFFHTNASLDYTIVRLRRNPYRLTRFDRLDRFGPTGINPVLNPRIRISEFERHEQLNSLKDALAEKNQLSSIDLESIIAVFGYTPGSRYGFVPLRSSVSYPIGLRLNVVQHPRGRKKEVVVQQNELRDVHANVIHYFSDTDYGSSGSPVFNNTWDLMALHHAREPSESANEGIRIDKIVADLRAQFQSSRPEILTELEI